MTGLATATSRRHALSDADVRKLALLGLDPKGLSGADDPVTGALTRLRAMVPRRSLGWREAERVAERQADRLRNQLGVLRPRLSEDDLTTLPWLTITRHEDFPTAGASTKTEYGWIIVLRRDDIAVRQRFTLAHEFKHILDDTMIERGPAGLYPPIADYSAHERIERICDRFAAALLMPSALLRADWTDGLQDIAKLAKRYDVSRAAMRIRLSQLGLLEQALRCPGPAARSGETR
jgi:Zn-dependent peptidase ImmA (M78 family)